MLNSNISKTQLNLLPIAAILFDNKKIILSNNKAQTLFKINSKDQNFDIEKFLLDDTQINNTQIQFSTSLNETIKLTANYSYVLFENKKVVQCLFFENKKDTFLNKDKIIDEDVYTEQKLKNKLLTQALKEKEILLKEVHHRVKNNMQVISSILNLQSSYVKDSYALSLLKDCQNRIKSMAFIHESLYQNKNLTEVNFAEYISSLTKNLVHSYSTEIKNIKLLLNLKNVYLNLDASISCGLILNELISNSLKYAFPNNKAGIIFVNLSVKDKLVNIEIGDNGIGINENLDIKKTPTLGLQLVNTLVEQINGKIKVERKNGTKFNIEFNI